jgi:hypothetical protein
MKTILAIITFLSIFISESLFSQQSIVPVDQDQIILKPDTSVLTSKVPVLKAKRLDTGLDIGTSFSYSPRNYYGPSFYIAPNVTYKISRKFQIHAGLIYEKSTFYPLYQIQDQSNSVLPMTRTLLYTSGSYLLTPNLTVSGTVYKSFNNIPKLTNYQDPYQYNIEGYQLDIQYKINNSITFGVQVLRQNSTFDTEPIH